MADCSLPISINGYLCARPSKIAAIMYLFTTDYLYTGQGNLERQAWLHLDAAGIVIAWGKGLPPIPPNQHIPGLIFGGLVNAHCHLELSHLKGRIPTGTGMAGFVRELQKIRGGFAEEEVVEAAKDAAKAMYACGIAAVGDICNSALTMAAKLDTPGITFHNFIEVFGLDPTRAENILLNALELAEKMPARNSITLHAPYSVSPALRDRVQAYAQAREWPQSIHLLESVEERQLFEELDGPLMQMLRDFGVPFSGHAAGSAFDYIVPSQPRECPTMLVHVTEINEDEIAQAVKRLGQNAFFVLCPNANHYIHNTHPQQVGTLIEYGAKVCIGTDSLAGNWKLDLWSEMRTLQENFGVDTGTLMEWAVDNGCEALQIPKDSFIPTPGKEFRIFHMPNFETNWGRIPQEPIIDLLFP